MICDEATSALDAESEKKVQSALDKILETRAGVIVAHRLSTIRNATRIYVFDAGEIVEIGNHKELVEMKGHYYNLVKRQLKSTEEKKEEEKKRKAEENSDSKETSSYSGSNDGTVSGSKKVIKLDDDEEISEVSESSSK